MGIFRGLSGIAKAAFRPVKVTLVEQRQLAALRRMPSIISSRAGMGDHRIFDPGLGGLESMLDIGSTRIAETTYRHVLFPITVDNTRPALSLSKLFLLRTSDKKELSVVRDFIADNIIGDQAEGFDLVRGEDPTGFRITKESGAIAFAQAVPGEEIPFFDVVLNFPDKGPSVMPGRSRVDQIYRFSRFLGGVRPYSIMTTAVSTAFFWGNVTDYSATVLMRMVDNPMDPRFDRELSDFERFVKIALKWESPNYVHEFDEGEFRYKPEERSPLGYE